ncbi:MAG: hypothetical protein IH587_04170, partial [Anaerolineae bacterium]|nr:hypothetical protein [Anaerolineae bacterium]
YYSRIDVGAVALLPQLVQGRWVSLLGFHWREPQQFDEQFKRICEIIVRRAGPAINSIRLLEQNRERTQRAEMLSEVNTALSQARSESEILDAMQSCARSFAEPYKMSLIYVNLDTDGRPIEAFNAASVGPLVYMAQQNKIYALDDTPFPMIASLNSEISVFVEDMVNDPRFSEEDREIARKIENRSAVILPLRSANTWQGVMLIVWDQPRDFSDQERYLYTRLLPTLASVVASRRAYLEAQASQNEASTLYRVSKEINTASTYHDIVHAVAKLDFGPGDIYLNMFENFNFDGARYFDIVATATDMFNHEGQRWWIKDYPLVERFPKQGVFVNENIADNPDIDAASKEMFLRLGVHSNMRVSLSLHNRWIGGLGIDSPTPRLYSEREKRLMAGVGDLVVAAVERIRLQQETIAAAEAQRQAFLAEQDAREEREVLFRASQAINAANSFHEILSAVSHIDFDGDFYLSIFENFDYQNATYIESVSTAKGEFIKGRRRFMLDEVPYFTDQPHPGLSVIEDTTSPSEIDPITRETLLSHGIVSGMRFGLAWNGRVLGAFGVDNAQPKIYSAREKRQMTALGELVAAAVERIRLQQETTAAAEAQRQALLAEKEAREETTALYQVSKAINQATKMSQVVEAAKQLFPEPVDVAVFAWENYDRSHATYLESIAATDANVSAGMRLPREVVSWPAMLDPTQLLVANDVNSPEWANHRAADSARLFGLHSIAYVNLMHSQRVQGLFAIGCYEPYNFTPKEIRLMAAIADLTAAAMERFRSRQAEQEALEEREILFRASQAINAANSFYEILSAINLIDFDGGDCYMYIFEDYDFQTATYIETVATGKNQFMHQGMRVALEDVPFLKTHPRPGLWAYEDIANHPELDPVTKATMLSHGVASNLRYGLV